MTYNSGDEEEVLIAKTTAQLEREKELEELRKILSTKIGRAFVWRLLEKCRMFESVPIVDSLQLAASASLTNYGKWLLGEIVESDSKVYSKMQEEADERQKELQRKMNNE